MYLWFYHFQIYMRILRNSGLMLLLAFVLGWPKKEPKIHRFLWWHFVSSISAWFHRIHECVRLFEFKNSHDKYHFVSLNWLWRRCGPLTFKMFVVFLWCVSAVLCGQWRILPWTMSWYEIFRLFVWYDIFWLQYSGTIRYYPHSLGEVVDFLYSLFFSGGGTKWYHHLCMYAYPVLPKNQGVYTSRQDHWPKWPHWIWGYSSQLC